MQQGPITDQLQRDGPGQRPRPDIPNCPRGYERYTWRRGDTLIMVARRLDVSIEELRRANPGVNFARLSPGDQICVPPSRPNIPNCPRGFERYTWRRGDTLIMVARRLGVSIDALRRANPDVNFSRLNPGDQICVPPSRPACPNGRTYVVRRGDTFNSIARSNNITVRELLEANPYINPSTLMVGQVICIPRSDRPMPPRPPVCPPGYTQVSVRLGDTLQDILTRYNISLNALRLANPNVNFSRLMPGQRLCIPPPETRGCRLGGVRYTMQQGETLASLAARLRVPQVAILRLNPTLAPNDFVPGTSICIPG